MGVQQWQRALNAPVIPLQKYGGLAQSVADGENAESRRPKRSVPDNVNYYDHNILGLQNRDAVTYSNSRRPSEANPTQQHTNSSGPITEMAKRAAGVKSGVRHDGVIDAHRFCQLDFIQSDTSVKFDDFRKSRPVPHDHPVVRPEELTKECCPECYNERLAVVRQEEVETTKAEDVKRFADMANRVEKEDVMGKQQLVERKIHEKTEVVDPSVKAPDRSTVSPKITQKISSLPKEPTANTYNYEGYGRDHCREVEDGKEKRREKMRSAVEDRLAKTQSHLTEKDKLVPADAPGHLALPSYHSKPDNRAGYRRWLLEQIETDRTKRMQRREQERMSQSVVQPFGDEEVVFERAPAEKRRELKQEYYASLKKIEQEKVPSHRSSLGGETGEEGQGQEGDGVGGDGLPVEGGRGEGAQAGTFSLAIQ